ncbi:MAG: hypothetical protein Q8J84_07740 [Flavobacteriaceae bacterium]|nr:hypothetical protein [Flavobacteriaceae bacterium]
MSLRSCYYDEAIPVFEEPVELPPGTVVTFKANIAPMLSRCTTCHGGSTSPDMRNTQTAYNGLIGNYVVKNNPSGSKLYTFAPGSATSGHMNVGFTLNATELATMKLWIETDAKYE